MVRSTLLVKPFLMMVGPVPYLLQPFQDKMQPVVYLEESLTLIPDVYSLQQHSLQRRILPAVQHRRPWTALVFRGFSCWLCCAPECFNGFDWSFLFLTDGVMNDLGLPVNNKVSGLNDMSLFEHAFHHSQPNI